MGNIEPKYNKDEPELMIYAFLKLAALEPTIVQCNQGLLKRFFVPAFRDLPMFWEYDSEYENQAWLLISATVKIFAENSSIEVPKSFLPFAH